MKPSPETLRVVAFDGGWNLPIWIGQQQGFFAAEGIDVELLYTPNSTALVDGLIEGTHDIAFAAADNFIACRERGTAHPASAELFMLAGGDAGFLSLFAAPDISEITQLRGRTLAVDALTTGFAFVARELLANRGIGPDEVSFEKAGGTDQRYRALIAGKHAATLLRTPYDILAAAQGFQRLAVGSELGEYQGTVAAARRTWAETHRGLVVRFLRAYHRSLAWCFDESNRTNVEAVLCAHVEGLEARTAAAAAAQLLAPTAGLTPGMRLNTDGLATVMRLRRKFAEQPHNVTSLADYIDDSFLDAALRR